MTYQAPARPPVDPIDAPALRALALLLQQRTGQQIAVERSWRIDSALKPLMREAGWDRPGQVLAAMQGNPAMMERVLDTLLNQETSFFRDGPVFDLIVEAVGCTPPALRPRLWSVGCSRGQEALSMAMALADRTQPGSRLFPEILATDVSPTVIARARAGKFTQFEIQRGLPVKRMIRWFDGGNGEWFARPELLRLISFCRHNVVSELMPAGLFDVITCRNVLLHFAPALRRTVLERLHGALRPAGFLVLGAGETVIGQSSLFRPSKRIRGLYEPADA